MKILHIHPSMDGGGIQAIICSLANEMVKICDITVCSIYEPSFDDIFWNKLDPKVKKKTIGKKRNKFSLKEIWLIYKFFKRNKFDVVYLHGYMQYYFVAILLLHKKIRFFNTIHSDAFKDNIGWNKRLFFFIRLFYVYRWVTPITISDASQKSFTNLYNTTSELIYNGVSKPIIDGRNIPLIIKKYKYSSLTKILIHPGRISEAKNQVVLCKVVSRLIDEGCDIVLLIAGAKQDLNIYSKIEKFFSDRIIFLGERDDIPQLLAHSDAMCLPSLWEGLPITLLEALSVGCIPICSPVGGIVNVIKNKENGLLSASSDEIEYYKTLKYFINMDEVSCREIKRKCLLSFDVYDIKKTAMSYLDLINNKR